MQIIKVGTRSSKLAIAQAQQAVTSLERIYPNYHYQIIPIITTGDKIIDRPLYDIGGKALFIKELEYGLIEDKIDIAVHSMKDVPGKIHDGLSLVAFLERIDAAEVIVSTKFTLDNLTPNALIGTSSMRRTAQLLALKPTLNIVPVRGNVPTRIDKVLNGSLDATLLAKAGIERLGIKSPYIHDIDTQLITPAVGQGVIVLQIKKINIEIKKICEAVNHQPTQNLIAAERGFLEHLDADCKTPLGAYAKYDKEGKIICEYFLSSLDFVIQEKLQLTCGEKNAYETGIKAAEILKKKVGKYK